MFDEFARTSKEEYIDEKGKLKVKQDLLNLIEGHGIIIVLESFINIVGLGVFAYAIEQKIKSLSGQAVKNS